MPWRRIGRNFLMMLLTLFMLYPFLLLINHWLINFITYTWYYEQAPDIAPLAWRAIGAYIGCGLIGFTFANLFDYYGERKLYPLGTLSGIGCLLFSAAFIGSFTGQWITAAAFGRSFTGPGSAII